MLSTVPHPVITPHAYSNNSVPLLGIAPPDQMPLGPGPMRSQGPGMRMPMRFPGSLDLIYFML